MFLPVGDVNPARRFPLFNYLLLAVNVAIGVWTFFWIPPERYEGIVMTWGFVPAREDWVTLVTSQFLHGGLAHLVGNMLFLWIVGDNVEDKLGHAGYLVFYLLCGVSAGLVHAAGDPGSTIPTIGASGAISGVLAAYAILFPWSRIKVVYFIPFFAIGATMVRAVWAIGFWFLQQFLYYAVSEPLGDMPGVAYGAHVGGFVTGGGAVLILLLFGRLKRSPSVR